ncbi:PqqD family protein [Methanosarcina sp. Z-7115]|uniref:PqqD family protein n=1 Tax=Methanosarcina baikalica TaxID=3073890 RepID=A0ABU2D1T3_9EURY|nr:PqqD family protein [Methanosarcina sp. Z-7115]MDR7665946.1 PqqD family protein [Methanosarcina sp. Z-7115]
MSYLEKCFEKDPNIVSRKIADEVILVPIRQNIGDLENIYVLNTVAAFIWENIDGRKRIKDVNELIIEEFFADKDVVERDVVKFIQDLEMINCITLKGD